MADFVRPRLVDELKELGNARVAQAVLFARRVNTGQDAASFAGVPRRKSRTKGWVYGRRLVFVSVRTNKRHHHHRELGIKGRKQHLMPTARQVVHLVVV
jgi:hypothetical protein